jgi:hypothetical protein
MANILRGTPPQTEKMLRRLGIVVPARAASSLAASRAARGGRARATPKATPLMTLRPTGEAGAPPETRGLPPSMQVLVNLMGPPDGAAEGHPVSRRRHHPLLKGYLTRGRLPRPQPQNRSAGLDYLQPSYLGRDRPVEHGLNMLNIMSNCCARRAWPTSASHTIAPSNCCVRFALAGRAASASAAAGPGSSTAAATRARPHSVAVSSGRCAMSLVQHPRSLSYNPRHDAVSSGGRPGRLRCYDFARDDGGGGRGPRGARQDRAAGGGPGDRAAGPRAARGGRPALDEPRL